MLLKIVRLMRPRRPMGFLAATEDALACALNDARARGCGADGLLALGDLYPAGDISPSYVLPPSTPDSPLYMNSRIRPQPRLNVC